MQLSKVGAPLLIALAVSCAGGQGLDPRIPKDGPGGLVRYSPIRIEISLHGINVQAPSISQATTAQTEAELRRLLIALPVSDWPNGRHIGIGLPSIGVPVDDPTINTYLRRTTNVLGRLGIDFQIVS